MAARQAILFRAHAVSPGAARCLQRLVAESGRGFDVWVVGFCRSPEALAAFGHPLTCAYDQPTLARLPYPAKQSAVRWEHSVGHHDLPVLQFFRAHPDYARYWIVEYDVRYTGHWGALFDDCGRSEAGLLGTTMQRREENPAWYHWQSVATGADVVAPAHWIRGFMPFAAATPALLDAIDARYRQGWTGHYEATWPMIASLAGLGVEDIGGSGAFVPPGRERRHYWNTPLDPYLSPGSFVFRPTAVPDEDGRPWQGQDAASMAWAAAHLREADRLVHPVKD